jgi:NAD(P)-dependent dehydrogenase (short-subunit alcohol dehydrogenase family)
VHGPDASADVPAGATYLRADYGRLAEVVALARDIRSATDRVDVLVNNAARPITTSGRRRRRTPSRYGGTRRSGCTGRPRRRWRA